MGRQRHVTDRQEDTRPRCVTHGAPIGGSRPTLSLSDTLPRVVCPVPRHPPPATHPPTPARCRAPLISSPSPTYTYIRPHHAQAYVYTYMLRWRNQARTGLCRDSGASLSHHPWDSGSTQVQAGCDLWCAIWMGTDRALDRGVELRLDFLRRRHGRCVTTYCCLRSGWRPLFK